MIKQEPCPKCGNVIDHEYITDNISVVEEYAECGKCDYFVSWAYGIHFPKSLAEEAMPR